MTKVCSRRANEVDVLKEHVAFSCHSRHSRLGLFLACHRLRIHLESVCEKYGSVSMVACQSCFSRIDAVHFETCRSEETLDWCDHPHACSVSSWPLPCS